MRSASHGLVLPLIQYGSYFSINIGRERERSWLKGTTTLHNNTLHCDWWLDGISIKHAYRWMPFYEWMLDRMRKMDIQTVWMHACKHRISPSIHSIQDESIQPNNIIVFIQHQYGRHRHATLQLYMPNLNSIRIRVDSRTLNHVEFPFSIAYSILTDD